MVQPIKLDLHAFIHNIMVIRIRSDIQAFLPPLTISSHIVAQSPNNYTNQV